MRLFKISALLIMLSLVLASCGDDIGSFSLGEDWFSTPKAAFEYVSNQEPASGQFPAIEQEMGVYALNSEYSVYFAVMEYPRNGGASGSAPTVLLMKTKDGKYQYLGNSESFFGEMLEANKDEEYTVSSTKLTAGDKTYDFSFVRTEGFDKEDFEGYNIYETSVKLDGEELPVTVAISK